VIFYLYALASGLQVEVTSLAGVRDEALVSVEHKGINAIAGWMERAPEVARDTLLAQDRVVRHLHARAAALLPMRFGSSLDDENQAREFVERRRTVLQEQLELVRGREQMTLRILGPSPAVREEHGARAEKKAEDPEGPGARYLARRAADKIPPSLRSFDDRLQAFQRAVRVELHRHPELIATIYHLVDRGTADVYRRAVEDAARQERLNIRISGPLPAYAFANVR
jgi:Gas vesicle synthesis protein GvpL/GvpF